MRRTLCCISLLFLCCSLSFGTIGVVVDAATVNGTGNLTATLTGSCHSDAYGMFILFVCDTAGSDRITSISIDNGIGAMAELAQNTLTTGERGNVQVWYKASAITAATAYAAAVTVAATGTKAVYFFLFTGDTDLEIIDSDVTINSTSQANPSVTMSHGSRSAADALAFWSGQGAPSGCTPLTGWTDTFTCPEPDITCETDFGAEINGAYATTAATTSDVTAGLTQTADDILMIAVSVAEVVASGQVIIVN